ncbi:MAG: C40 family peptidase [Enterocloster asparagiformis]|nr:C40 family peptidase [Enterocloster asparagiformis]
MKKLAKILIAGGVCSVFWVMPASASTNLETSSSLAGISVALNNFYASTEEPEQALSSVFDAAAATSVASNNGGGTGQAAQATAAATTAAPETTKAKSSAYDNVAVSKVNGYVNIRTEANTTSGVTGKIYNDSAATILETVDGEGGKWYKIKSGSVTGYIKAEYFVTGAEAETRAKQVGTQYGTVVGTPTLRLRKSPDLTSQTLTLLSEGAHYVVLEEQGDFLKVAVDSDLEGYVFKDYMKTSVEFQKAVSAEEEQAKADEEARRKKEAEEAIRKLEEAKEAERKKSTTAAETTKKETTTAEAAKPKDTTASGTIAANPEQGGGESAAAPTTAKETTAKPKETTVAAGPGGGSSGEVTSATRTAIVAYAKQFLGNPYVYGGTSLTSGADCSGFVMSVYSHFGISTGRSSRDQAAKGRTISTSDVKPGDLLFYASGDYINHVAIYIGGGQVIHSSTPTTGICIAPANYRTPCKAVTFLD